MSLAAMLDGAPMLPPILGATLKAWYDASDPLTVISSGGLVSDWYDKSGNAFHLAQGTAARKPSLATQNGLQCVDFQAATWADANGDYIESADVAIVSQPSTIYVVIVIDTMVSAGWPGADFFDGRTARQHLGLAWNADADWRMYAGTTRDQGAPTTGPHEVMGVFNGVGSVLHVDAANVALGGTPGAGALQGVRLGCFTPGTAHFDGKICEVLVYSGAHTSAEWTPTEAYLKAKWATP